MSGSCWAGLDIGSRTVKLVLVNDRGEPEHHALALNSYDPLTVCKELLAGFSPRSITVTGYGRHLFARNTEAQVITEIKAHAIGVIHQLPDCRTILDIGGQDTKAIRLDESGAVDEFALNDRCAAGTGRFLEVMAMALGYGLEEFGRAAAQSHTSIKVSAMCAVFAESEVVSLLGRGASASEVARGLHEAIIQRASALLSRVGPTADLAFVGGVSQNTCLRQLLAEATNMKVFVPPLSQVNGALGAALEGRARFLQESDAFCKKAPQLEFSG